MTSDSGFLHSAAGQMTVVAAVAIVILFIAWKYVF